mmetsp:Transcript_54289/g.139860  ORF Transcript_54289/g.139860 Transcript_54289/m.139860 type:complete len:283 (+) Transcript_54289:2238-3086(+)
MQEILGSGPQCNGGASFVAGLHGSTQRRDSFAHGLPLPLAYVVMVRVLSWTPKQSEEQSDHEVHSESSQFTSASQAVVLSHTSYSSSRPTADLPHLLACRACWRWRARTEEPQVVAQPDHSFHSPQAPSMHSLQGPVLQGITSALSFASHASPPFCGISCTTRLRRFEPPPQVAVHAPHSFQSAQVQSDASHSGISHDLTSLREATQPKPSDAPTSSKLRVRSISPMPQVFEHGPHPDHAFVSHSWTSWHLLAPQAIVSLVMALSSSMHAPCPSFTERPRKL